MCLLKRELDENWFGPKSLKEISGRRRDPFSVFSLEKVRENRTRGILFSHFLFFPIGKSCVGGLWFFFLL